MRKRLRHITNRNWGLLTPYAGLSLSEGNGRAHRMGGRWKAGEFFTLSLEGDRREGSGDADHEILLRFSLRW